MSNSRAEILGRVRAAKKDMLADTNAEMAAQRIQDHSANLIPKRGSLGKQARLELFQTEAERVDASVVRVKTADDITQEVARFLKDHNLPMQIKSAPCLKNLPWSTTLIQTKFGIAHGDDTVGVTAAFAGVAETGTLVTYSSPDTPTTLNFLPLTNIAILEADKVYGNYEQVFKALRERSGREQKAIEFMPRTLNFITGPSRSADIEQTLLLGAHGPQRLHIIIVDDDLP